MIKKRLDVNFKVKSIEKTGEFSGYASVFGVKDSYSDIVVKGAFTESLNGWKQKGRFPAMLWMHDVSEPIGAWTKMLEDDNGLYVEGKLLIDADPLAKRAHAHLVQGSLDGISIGYSLDEGGWEYDSEKEAFMLKKINLWEASIVTFPANDEARVSDVKNALSHGETPSPKLVERCLRDVGFSVRQAKAFMADGYKGVSNRDDADALELLHLIQSLNK